MLTFFLYSTEQTGILRHTAKAGEYALYIALGAVFAQTFMGRLGLFVGYMVSITDPAWKVPWTFGLFAVVLGGILIMDRYGILEKYAD
jgi:biotin transporter BioY